VQLVLSAPDSTCAVFDGNADGLPDAVQKNVITACDSISRQATVWSVDPDNPTSFQMNEATWKIDAVTACGSPSSLGSISFIAANTAATVT
jgi:hypothetical protein